MNTRIPLARPEPCVGLACLEEVRLPLVSPSTSGKRIELRLP